MDGVTIPKGVMQFAAGIFLAICGFVFQQVIASIRENTDQAKITANAMINVNAHMEHVTKNQEKHEKLLESIAASDIEQNKMINKLEKTVTRTEAQLNNV